MLHFDIIHNDLHISVSTYLRTFEHEQNNFEIEIFFLMNNFSYKVSGVVLWVEWSCKVSRVVKWGVLWSESCKVSCVVKWALLNEKLWSGS